jgi:hypothetical protein
MSVKGYSVELKIGGGEALVGYGSIWFKAIF